MAAKQETLFPLAALPLTQNSHPGRSLPTTLLYPVRGFVCHSARPAYLHPCTILTPDLVRPPRTGTQNDDIVVTATKKTSQLLRCTADHFGLTALGSGMAAAGANLLGAGGKFSGATPGTSLASKAAGSLLGDLKLPLRLPTLTGFPGIGNGLRVSFTESAARFVGRAVLVVGYALLAYDAYQIGTCTVNGGE